MLKCTKNLLIRTIIYFLLICCLLLYALYLSHLSSEAFGWFLIFGMFGGIFILAIIYILLSIWYFPPLFFYFSDRKTELMEKICDESKNEES